MLRFHGKIRIASFNLRLYCVPGRRSFIKRAGVSLSVMHLKNVIWQALTTRQSPFAESHDSARKFLREVTALCAFAEPNEDGYADLACLAGVDGTAAVFLDQPYEPRLGWDYVVGAPLLQMICENGHGSTHLKASTEIVELGDKDSPEMLELTAMTKPGPFGPRTHKLGYYVGIRDNGKLVAMAGERLKVLGFTEVSAVCTHPDHLGKGYAGALMSEVMRGIRERGEIPFLHVRADNVRAIGVYERLGFRTAWQGHFAVLRRTA
jgi:ribosomal protein S18 acetylase RimI-like enzyme